MYIRNNPLNNKYTPELHYDSGDYSVEVSYDKNIEILKSEWISLQQDQDLSFFLTWNWISNWIKIYKPEIITLSAKYNHETVAIGLFTKSLEKRHKVTSSKQLRLHQTGQKNQDQIWIEYNDFLCKPGHQDKAVNACLNVLNLSVFKWDEIVFSMMPAKRLPAIEKNNFKIKTLLKVPCFSVDLKRIRKSDKSYLKNLSSNTRYQIRRSIKEYEKLFGKLTLEFAENKKQALRYFHEAGKMHLERWDDSGFNNAEFTRFHEQLILDNFAKDSVELIKVTTGSSTIAIMYNLILDKRIYFYLQGLKYEKNKKCKPGMVAHSLITQHYLDKGMDLYDYMGGYSQYKSQLATHSSDCYTICIQRPQLKFFLEDMGRKLRNFITR